MKENGVDVCYRRNRCNCGIGSIRDMKENNSKEDGKIVVRNKKRMSIRLDLGL